MKKYLIGLDFGTDSVRALLTDTQGKELGIAIQEYPRWKNGLYCDAAISQFRQSPLDHLECMESVLKEVLAEVDSSCVAGIGVDTTGSTIGAVDANGTSLALLPGFEENPNAMFVLWKDHTAAFEAEKINTAASQWTIDYRKYTGGNYSCEWFWSKIMHILNTDPNIRSAVFSWVEHCDWITAVLTGKNNPLTMARSRCAAGHKALWHASWGGLPPEDFLRSVDPMLAEQRKNLYSDTVTGDQSVGFISPEWAQKLNLPTDTVIAGGILDCHAGAIGANIKEHTMVSVFGTSTCDLLVSKIAERCIPDICGQVDGSIIPGMIAFEAGQSAFGDVFAWFKRFLSAGGQQIDLAELERAAADLKATDSDVFAVDWFNGRRSPGDNPNLRGAIFGLNLGTSPTMVYRALTEAVCCGFRKIVDHFRNEGIQIEQVLATGGIAKKSPFIMQMCANLLNLPIQTVKSEQVCALGGAMNAATAAGIYKSLQEAMQAMASGYDQIYQPQSDQIEEYEKIYLRYIESAKLLERLRR